MSVKALLKRVRRLEPKPSRILLKLGGSMEKFEALVQEGIEAERYCPHDLPRLVTCFKRWIRDGY